MILFIKQKERDGDIFSDISTHFLPSIYQKRCLEKKVEVGVRCGEWNGEEIYDLLL